ncbi:hypothetical protein [Lichenifustis flavocetrariae]|uniref:Bulb-type lectin domain-containing protein n=1 Tax=Lichenifustis flavocetrariae TaxID=2949735 RepID=A0AA41YW51_9HYPH|nr:hypothetical protein [Lichenifustis flavocetrariae]MCW6508321.1 hypothetical protein [Lichenifustis flavocetrariae]
MTDKLFAAQILTPSQSITSGDGRFNLILQEDGNLVLYRVRDHHALWSSGTNGQDIKRAAMQGDGNFVLYHTDGRPSWATNTNGKNGSFLILQNDGNLVIYWPQDPVWASGTVQ